ncbi:hypothetical protein [Pseudomonas sp. SDO55104_S430]
MKTISQLIAVATFALSATAFAVPSNQEDRFFTQVSEQQHTIAADGSDRTPGMQVAADGSDRTPGMQVAADGSDRTPGMQVAADGSDRTLGRRLA